MLYEEEHMYLCKLEKDLRKDIIVFGEIQYSTVDSMKLKSKKDFDYETVFQSFQSW
jgi:hypothetical protein